MKLLLVGVSDFLGSNIGAILEKYHRRVLLPVSIEK